MLKNFILPTLILIMSASLTACQSNTITSKELSYRMACGTALGKSLICTDEKLKVEVVDGIKIAGVDGALFYNSTVSDNQKLANLIKRVLAKDKSAVKELLDVDCGGGAGCYDLGFIFSQLVFKIGEDEFISLTTDLNSQDKGALLGFIDVGLEYGYEPYSTKTTKSTFPKLYKVLYQK